MLYDMSFDDQGQEVWISGNLNPTVSILSEKGTFMNKVFHFFQCGLVALNPS